MSFPHLNADCFYISFATMVVGAAKRILPDTKSEEKKIFLGQIVRTRKKAQACQSVPSINQISHSSWILLLTISYIYMEIYIYIYYVNNIQKYLYIRFAENVLGPSKLECMALKCLYICMRWYLGRIWSLLQRWVDAGNCRKYAQ